MTGIISVMRTLLRSPTRSIGTKVFLVFFSFVVVSVASLGLFSFSTAQSAIINQMKSSSEQMIKLAGEKLDMKQQFYSNLLNQLVNNSSFTENLFQLSSTSVSVDERQRRMDEIRGLFDQLALSDSHIRDITLFPLEDPIGPISTQREGIALNRDATWIKEIQQAEGQAAWLSVEEKGYLGSGVKPLFAYGKILGPHNVGSKQFALLVQIESTVLQQLVDGVKLSEGAETALLDSKGRRIISNQSNTTLPAIVLSESDNENLTGNEIRKDAQGKSELVAYRRSAVSSWTLAGKAPLEELIGAANKIRTLTYASIAGCVLIALFIGIWIVLMIGKPLGKMLALMKQAADGNLRGRMAHNGKDEIGQVAHTYNQMMEQIGNLVIETRRTVDEVAHSSSHMAAAAKQTASSAEETHLAIGQIAESVNGLAANAEVGSGRVEEMGARLSEVFDQQDMTAVSAQEVSNACHEGEQTVGGLIRKTAETEVRFRQVSERVIELEKSAYSIHELLKLMNQIAKQTKILSLNASIEATRSGLAGAGFKVIADEIRQLAERSNSSIGHVGNLTENIQEEVASTVSAMTLALPFFQEMIREVHAVDRLFGNVQQQMKQLITRSDNVTRSLRHLDETQEMLIASASEVSAVSQQSSAASEQVASLCAEQLLIGERLVELSAAMRGVSMKLEQQMSRFQV